MGPQAAIGTETPRDVSWDHRNWGASGRARGNCRSLTRWASSRRSAKIAARARHAEGFPIESRQCSWMVHSGVGHAKLGHAKLSHANLVTSRSCAERRPAPSRSPGPVGCQARRRSVDLIDATSWSSLSRFRRRPLGPCWSPPRSRGFPSCPADSRTVRHHRSGTA